MFSRFFIDRPIFAAVLSIAITLGGGLAAFNLPLAQYPPVTPPTVQVNCNYPGASAQIVAETVAAPIEQQVNGVENMLYMSSQCTNDGSYNLTVTIKQGVDLNLAQVLVQNRVNLALPMLPDVLKATGVTTRKMSPDILMSVNINSPNGRYDQLYLSNYALMRLRDELLRLPGIGDIFISGQRDYSMRIWVDPRKLETHDLSASDVVKAIREQNAQVACGQIGQQPAPNGQEFQITLSTLGRLVKPEQFADIILRADADGRILRIRDVARVELGAKNQDIQCKLDGKPSVGLIIFQLPDANALDVAESIHKKMRELARNFPEDMIYEIQYDTTPYTRECIVEVLKSLRTAIVLVALVVLLFLQNWRSALIPLVAVPVAIIGTFGVMLVMGFSLNNLTLFGLVLAIGIVVDNAIVVVEAVEYHIERGLGPRDATIQAMEQLSAPVIAVGLVLSAVFIPCAFISGITGQFFRQFALTIASSTIISTFNSLTLSPALAAILLKSRDKETHEPLPRLAFPILAGWLGYEFLAPWLGGRLAALPWPMPAAVSGIVAAVLPWLSAVFLAIAAWFSGRRLNAILRWGFRWFDRGFNGSIAIYLRVVGTMLRGSFAVIAVYGAMLGLTYWSFTAAPKGFIPSQDMGYLLVNVQLPDAASAERCREVTDKVSDICRSQPGIRHTMAVAGQSFMLSAYASNFGSMFVILDDFDKRRKPELHSTNIATALQKRFAAEVPEAMVAVLPPPPVRGVGRTGGFKFMVEDLANVGSKTLQEQTDKLAETARKEMRPNAAKRPMLNVAPNVFRANIPQLYVNMNRAQCISMGVPLSDAFATLQVFLGSLYVNDFNRFGRTWQVVVQADAEARNQVESASRLKVRNTAGSMVALGSLADIEMVNGPLILTRYNMHQAAAIQGAPEMGVSSRQAIDLMEHLADRELPATMHYEWTELAYLELQAGNTAMIIFGLAIVAVFLVLAAQYESWSLPLAVILVVPLCLLGAIAGMFIAHMDINIFTQVGFVVLVGLASKNAILIVEYAKRSREGGMPRHETAIAACRLRLRPIMMTSTAFILGVSSLIFAAGAGAEMRRTLGTAVFSGMLGVTLFGIFLTPVFFVTVDRASQTRFFQSRAVRFIGKAAMIVFTLGFVGIVFRQIRNARRNKSNGKSEKNDNPEDL